MVDRVQSRLDCQELLHLKQTLRGLDGCQERVIVVLVVECAGHAAGARVVTGRIDETSAHHGVIAFKLLMVLLLLVCSHFAVEVSENCLHRSAWLQRKSVRVLRILGERGWDWVWEACEPIRGAHLSFAEGWMHYSNVA